jgi:hypothetical protein
MTISEKPWDGSAGRFTPEQWRSSCILHLADTLNKSDHKLPIKEPGGALSRAGVHAAASRFGSTQAPAEAKARAKASLRGAYKTLGEQPPDNIKASLQVTDEDIAAAEASGEMFLHHVLTELKAKQDEKVLPGEPGPNDAPRGTAIVALPPKDHPVNKVGDVQKHVTLAYSKKVEDPQAVHDHVANMAKLAKGPAVAHVAGKMQLGPDAAHAMLLESHDLQSLHHQAQAAPGMDDPQTAHAHFIPHMTTSAKGDQPPPDGMDDHEEIPLDRLAVWHGDAQQEYPLGADMAKKPPYEEDPQPDELNPGRQDPPSDQVPDGKKIPNDAKKKTRMGLFDPIPWHGVLAVEGEWTGDKRRFNKGSLSNRPLPLPLTWQKVSAPGHDGNVVVAKIEKIEVVDGEQRAAGHMLMTVPETDEFVGLLSEFGRFGVSIDADSVVFDLEGSGEEGVAFAEARTSSACAVPIPALYQAWMTLGEPPEEWGWDEVTEMPDEALVASLTAAGLQMDSTWLEQLRRGAGWVTHPEETKRIHDYWTTSQASRATPRSGGEPRATSTGAGSR